MLNFGIGEIIIIAALALVFVGPERLPDMLRFLGRQYGKVMRASYELRRTFYLEADRAEADRRAEALRARRDEARRRADEVRAQEAAGATGAPVSRAVGEVSPASTPAPSEAPAPAADPASTAAAPPADPR